MEAVIDEPLGDVLDVHTRGSLEGPRIENALVGNEAVLAGVQHRIMILQPLGDVVGAENGHFGRERQTVGAHHRDVRPRDRQDRWAPPRRGRHGPAALGNAEIHDRVVRQVRHEMRRDADRPHARAATAMRNAERLMEIQMTDVGAHVARPAQSHLGVHVGAVHVHLPAGVMHDPADLLDRRFEDAMCGRIRHHQRTQGGAVLRGLRPQIGHVDVAVRVRLYDDDVHPRHDGARGIRPMRRLGNQAGLPMSFAARLVIGANDEQAGEFPL